VEGVEKIGSNDELVRSRRLPRYLGGLAKLLLGLGALVALLALLVPLTAAGGRLTKRFPIVGRVWEWIGIAFLISVAAALVLVLVLVPWQDSEKSLRSRVTDLAPPNLTRR
jgi:uncharacterized membrane protein